MSYLLYLTGQPEAAEDLTQETFLQAWHPSHGLVTIAFAAADGRFWEIGRHNLMKAEY